MSRARFLLMSLVLSAFAGTAEASVYKTDFLDKFLGNTFIGGAATEDRIELRMDDPGLAGDNRKTYGNSGIPSFGNAVGGEFRVEAYKNDNSYNTYSYNPLGQPGVEWVFKTFCLEVGRTFSANSPYYVTIDPYALSGANKNSQASGSDWTGLPAGTFYDELSDATKLLYGLYFEGKLNTVYSAVNPANNFSYANDVSASMLQETIWALEDTQPNSAPSLSAGAAALKLWAEGRSSSEYLTYANKVQVMNLWDQYDSKSDAFSGDRQSQLVYIPQSTPNNNNPVPEPGAMLTWSLLTAASVLFIRRRRAKSA